MLKENERGKKDKNSDARWCAFSGSYDCPTHNIDGSYCKESLRYGFCGRKHSDAANGLKEATGK